MIPGIVASQAGAIALPASALVELDFVNHVYSVAGELVAASEVIDHPEWITDNGLEVLWSNETTEGSGIAHLIGDVLATLLTLDWTIVLEYQEFFDGFITRPFTMLDGGDVTFIEELSLARGNGSDLLRITVQDFDDATPDVFRFVGGGASHGIGIHRIAVTRTNDRLSISVGGEAVRTSTAASTTLALINATIGGNHEGWLFNEMILRSLVIYPAQGDPALQVLSS
jgi:hypothetical protein